MKHEVKDDICLIPELDDQNNIVMSLKENKLVRNLRGKIISKDVSYL